MNKRILYGSTLLWLLMICIDSHAQNTIDSLKAWPYYSFENQLIKDIRSLTWGRICVSQDYSYFSDQNIDHHNDGSVTIRSNQRSYYHINKDSSYVSYNVDSAYKQIECIQSADGTFDCCRYYSNGKIWMRTTFPNFDEAWLRLDMKWK